MAIDRKWSRAGIQKQTWQSFFCFASHPVFFLLVLIKLLSIRSIVNCIWFWLWRGCKLGSDSCSLLRRLTTRRFGFAFGRLKLRRAPPGARKLKIRDGAKCQSASSHTHTPRPQTPPTLPTITRKRIRRSTSPSESPSPLASAPPSLSHISHLIHRRGM